MLINLVSIRKEALQTLQMTRKFSNLNSNFFSAFRSSAEVSNWKMVAKISAAQDFGSLQKPANTLQSELNPALSIQRFKMTNSDLKVNLEIANFN